MERSEYVWENGRLVLNSSSGAYGLAKHCTTVLAISDDVRVLNGEDIAPAIFQGDSFGEAFNDTVS